MRIKRYVPLIAIGALGVITLTAGAISLGPERAFRIAAAATTNVLVDGMAERPAPHRIKVVELEVDPGALDSLNADLPWSGGDAKDAVLIENGIRYNARYRYRGLVASTHYLGGKKSFRLNLKKDNPFAPYRRLNIINPKANNFLNQHLAYRIAASMGVATPYSDLVFVRLNARDHGVHHVFEQVDGDFERNRHLVDHDVPVFKGDYPPAEGRNWPEGRYLWSDARFWEYVSNADSTEARSMLQRLVNVVKAPSMNDMDRMDSLHALIDVDAFVRYYAAQKFLHSTHADNVHNQWLVLSPRSGRFYPVLWDALLLFARPDPFYPIHDALEFHLMKDASLRLRRDRFIAEALQRWETDGGFDRLLAEEAERVRPSVLRDRNKHGEITDHAEDVLRFSALHWAGSCDKLRDGVHAYWKKLGDRIRIDSLAVRREGDVLIATWKSDGVLGFTAPGDSINASSFSPGMNDDVIFTEDPVTGDYSTYHEPQYPVSHSMGDKPRAIKDGEHWIAPRELRIQLNGTDPSRIRFINLTTDEPVEARL